MPEKVDETSYFFRDKRTVTEKLASNHTDAVEKEVKKIIKVEVEKISKSKF